MSIQNQARRLAKFFVTDEVEDPVDLIEASNWPNIPDAEVVKGNTLTSERLIELGAISGSPDSAQYAFRLLDLRDELMSQAKAKGTPLSIRVQRGGLHINTDPEAVQYHNTRGENGISMVKRQVSALATVVDASLLSSAERAVHDRRLCVWGARMASLRKASKATEQEKIS